MTAPNDPAVPAAASPGEPTEAQFGPHRFYAGEGGGSAGLSDDSLARICRRSPAPGYPDEERTVIDCIAVVMDEEIEHHRFAVRDLAVLEAS